MNSNGQNGIVHIRKPQSHFGWDWGPVLPLSGITKDIELQFVNTAKIDYLAVTQRLDDGKAIINAKADVTSFGNYDSEIKVTCPDGSVLTQMETVPNLLLKILNFGGRMSCLQTKATALYRIYNS